MLSVIGFIAVIIATYFVFKTAKENGRNALLWAAGTFGIGFGIQIVVPVLIGIVITVIMTISGSTIEEVQEFIEPLAIYIGIGCLITSFVGIGAMLRRVTELPEDESFISPPSPPEFD